MSRATLFTVAVLLAAAGCTKARTEAVVVVSTEGLRVPDDLDAITLVVADTGDLANPVFSKSFHVCGGAVASDCMTLPLDFTLIPGPHRNHSSRVQLTATRNGAPVIDDAAIFTFAEGVSLRLDFVLFANCLGVTDCAARDQACGPDAMCQTVPATPMSGEPDLSAGPGDMSAGEDLASAVDLAVPADLASTPGDMAIPRDLAMPPDLQMPDLAGCVPFCALGSCAPSNCNTPCPCGSQQVCGPSMMCQSCGNPTEPCCPGAVCSGTLHCYGGPPGTCDFPDMALPPGDMAATPDKVLTWTTMTYDSGTFYGIWAQGSDAFAVGDKATMGGVWRRAGDGALAFSADATYTQAATLHGVAGTDINHVWAAGDNATIVTYASGSWGAPPGTPPANTGNYHAVWVGGPGSPSVEIVGGVRNGSCMDSAIDAHFDGSLWRGGSVSMNACTFGAVWGNNLGFIAWPGNEHKIVFTTDDDMNEFTYQPSVNSNIYFRGIWGITKSSMWIVGDSGTIDHFAVDKFNQGTVSAETSNTTVQLNAVHGTSPSDLWAVGLSGVVLHSTGNGIWTQQTNAGNNMMQLNGVYALAPNDVYIVGALLGNKLIMHGQ